MQTYIRYNRNGKTTEKRLIPADLRLIKGENGAFMYVSRKRFGKTERDRRNRAHERNLQRKRARDAWRSQTQSAVYVDPSMVPAFPA